LTFCAGSLSAGIHNDVPALARKFASRTHFVHLRSTNILPNGDFVEASHLEGRANLLEVIRIFKSYPRLPMRVDHGPLMLTDINKKYNPGYSFLGRMKALAEVSGMMAAIRAENRMCE
jgi:mannonate dehydratase